MNKNYVPPKVTRHGSEADYPEWTKNEVRLAREGAEFKSSHERHNARRSPRILASIPLDIRGSESAILARTAVINLNGALILSSVKWGPGTELEFRNARTEVQVAGRVVWAGDTAPDGLHKLGVEFEGPSPDFWGKDYDPASVDVSELDQL